MRLLRAGRWLTAIALLLLAGVYVRALVYTPVERLQGLAQKIYYLHVPAAIWAETAMIIVGIASIFYLFLKDPRLDRFAHASAEVGTVFAVLMLATLLFSVSVFTLLYVGFVTQRYALSYLREQLEATAGGGDSGMGHA